MRLQLASPATQRPTPPAPIATSASAQSRAAATADRPAANAPPASLPLAPSRTASVTAPTTTLPRQSSATANQVQSSRHQAFPLISARKSSAVQARAVGFNQATARSRNVKPRRHILRQSQSAHAKPRHLDHIWPPRKRLPKMNYRRCHSRIVHRDPQMFPTYSNIIRCDTHLRINTQQLSCKSSRSCYPVKNSCARAIACKTSKN